MKTRLQLWKTFFRSHIFYGIECLMADKGSFAQMERIYSVSLKKALYVPKSCSVNKLLLHTNTWTLENLFL